MTSTRISQISAAIHHSCAASNGHEGLLKLLLARDDVNPNKSNRFGWTPLSEAICNGHEGVVKLLLG